MAGADRQAQGDEGFITRVGTSLCLGDDTFRFGGANMYWPGLDENVGGVAYPTYFRIADGLRTARDMGATVVRCQTCGISTGGPLSVEPSLGVFNPQAFNTIDYTLYQAQRLGLRVTIPFTDYWNYYLGSIYNFTQWLGQPACTSSTYACPAQAQFFYTNPQAIAAFEQYISEVINHVNRYTGVAYKNDPAVMYWELCNECNGMPASWVDTISAYIHSIAPRQLVAAGQQFGINSSTLTAPDVDVVDVHYYPPTPAQVQADASQITAAGKVYVAGEYGSVEATPALFSAMESDPAVTGADFWSLFPHNDTYGYVQHNDGFTIHYPGDTPQMQELDAQIRGFDYAMAQSPRPPRVNSSVPPEQRPGKPLITSITNRGTGNVIAWRGTTDAATYSVLRSATAHGPWTTVCARCATDNTTPWTDATPPAGPSWYEVIPYTLGGRQGTVSVPVEVSSGSATQVDPLENWNLTSAHSANVYLDGSDPQAFRGDLSRASLVAGSGQSGSIIWSQIGLRSISVDAYYRSSGQTPPVSIQVSTDGSAWTTVSATQYPGPGHREAGLDLHVLTASGLTRVNFARVVLSAAAGGGGLVEVGRTVLNYALPTMVDNETSLSAAYAYTGGGALVLDSSNPGNFGGDTSRVKRQYGTPDMVWHLAGTSTFQATAYYWLTQPTSPFTVEVSADGTNWSAVTPLISAVGPVVNGWQAYTYSIYGLTNANYIMMVWPATPSGGQPFSPELGNVDLYGPTA